jgi:uncharacterized delta-60 repeat protein
LDTSAFSQRLVRLNFDGTKDDSFVEQNFDPLVFGAFALGVQPDGRILVGGNGSKGQVLRRFEPSGEPDSTFQVNGTFGYIDLIRVQSNGQIIVGGTFSTLNGILRNRLARLNPDGTVDLSYDPGQTIFSPADRTFYDALVDADDNLYLGGTFTVVDDQIRDGIARLLPSGALDRTFAPSLGEPLIGSLWYIYDIALASGNTLFLADYFLTTF